MDPVAPIAPVAPIIDPIPPTVPPPVAVPAATVGPAQVVPIVSNPPNQPASLLPIDASNGCNQDFGPSCANPCLKTGGTCCWCDKLAQSLGLTQTCSCCPTVRF